MNSDDQRDTIIDYFLFCTSQDEASKLVEKYPSFINHLDDRFRRCKMKTYKLNYINNLPPYERYRISQVLRYLKIKYINLPKLVKTARGDVIKDSLDITKEHIEKAIIICSNSESAKKKNVNTMDRLKYLKKLYKSMVESENK